MRYAARTDGPHAVIRDGLRKYGWLVFDARGLHGGGPDLIASPPGRKRVVLFEVKRPRGRLRPKQQALIAQGWPIQIVTNLQEALAC